jgi:hypothetical protein
MGTAIRYSPFRARDDFDLETADYETIEFVDRNCEEAVAETLTVRGAICASE